MSAVIVYGRDGCHLCEDLLEDLRLLADKHGFELIERDVDSDPLWLARYHARVPVVEYEGEVVCEYFLDAKGLLERLNGTA